MICTGVDQQAGIAHARNFPKPTFVHDAIERLGKRTKIFVGSDICLRAI
jgi:hypothetical protein